MEVKRDDGISFKDVEEVHVPGLSLTMDPVGGQNLAGELESFTALAKPVKTAGENTEGTSILDERREFDFGRMAAGVYKITVPSGWQTSINKTEYNLAQDHVRPVADDDDNTEIVVTPTTGVLYGYVNAGDFGVKGATVMVNGVEVETDEDGRYIVEGFGKHRSSRHPSGTQLHVTVAMAGYNKLNQEPGYSSRTIPEDARSVAIPGFADVLNNPTQVDFDLSGSDKTATITGTVTIDGEPAAGVEIQVDYAYDDEKFVAPHNADSNADGNRAKVLTLKDGTYTSRRAV